VLLGQEDMGDDENLLPVGGLLRFTGKFGHGESMFYGCSRPQEPPSSLHVLAACVTVL
jgi:hypothetical protein